MLSRPPSLSFFSLHWLRYARDDDRFAETEAAFDFPADDSRRWNKAASLPSPPRAKQD